MKSRSPARVAGERKRLGNDSLGEQDVAHPLLTLFSGFQLTRINKLIISVVVVMGYSLLATSYNVLVTFIIFRDTLCGTLKRGGLGNALCKGSRNVRLLSFQLFIFLSVVSGFYVVFIFFLLTYTPLCSFLTYIFSFFPPTLSDFLFSI